MEVIDFSLPEGFGLNLFWMACRLPETTVAIATRSASEHLRKTRRGMSLAEVTELPAGELSKICHDCFQALGPKAFVEEDSVKMRWHDHVGVDPQPLMAMAEVQTVGNDLERSIGNENGQPLDNAERHEIGCAVG